MTQVERIKDEKIDHLEHILFNLIAERILKCPKCGYPYKEGYICDNCGADNSENEEEYPLDELIDIMQDEPVSENLEENGEEITDNTVACCNCVNGVTRYPYCSCWQHKDCNTDEPYKIPEEDWVKTAKTCKDFELELNAKKEYGNT